MFLGILSAFSQPLTETQRANIRSNIQRISTDSAMRVVLVLINPFALESDNDSQKINKLSTAVEILNVIEMRSPKGYDILEIRAEALEGLEDYQKALLDYSKAIQLYPKKESLYRKRAECKMQIEDYHGAITDITKCLTFLPNDDMLYGNRAWCYVMT